MERGVEHGHLRNARQDVFDGHDSLHVGRIVERGQFETAFDLFDDLFVHHGAVGEVFAAVRYAVTHGAQFVERSDHAVFGIGDGREDQVDTRRVVGNALDQFEFLLVGRFVGQDAVRETDPFHLSFGQQAVFGGRLHVDHLVFDRG